MFLYNLLIYGYGFVIRLSAIRNIKAKQWVMGRQRWRLHLADKMKTLAPGERIWVHCASYGEFEQGRPLMEAIKTSHPDTKIILTFFSPSGYEPFKNWNGADVVCYLPLDTPKNARDFIKLVNPHTALFIKYEFWINFLFELRDQSIRTFLVSAVFKSHHPFFKWYGGIFRRYLKTFHRLFIQDQHSSELLKSIGIQNDEVCGDTRIDRVLEIKEQFKPLPFFERFCSGHRVWVAGSTWPGDEELVISTYKKLNLSDLKLIIAPHNVDEKYIVNLTQLLAKNDLSYSLYSAQSDDVSQQVLIVDTIGLLSKLYYYADVAYIGGGFNSGIHNCLEPAVYLKPVVFYEHGYGKYNEVVDLVKLQAAKSVSGTAELAEAFLSFLNHPDPDLKHKLQGYFDKNSGVTKKVLQSIYAS